MKTHISILISLLWASLSYTQTQLRGKIIEEKTHLPLSHVMLVFYNETNNKIEDYTQSNEQGEYVFGKRFVEGIYKLEASKLGYHKNTQRIVIGTESNKTVTFDFALTSKTYQLEEVTFTKRPPIVVKKDTILYDIPHFTKTHDESLEEVLAKIQGFKILPNGEIEINGKLIRKVLINGKEVSDFGAAMITRSLSPEKVERVEVRFDEKDEKIKESLLNEEHFVVLDISLKNEVKKSLFGKQVFYGGYQQKPEIGGLTNLFSLHPKANIQFFAENNHFGKNEIDLSLIRHIGEESFAKIFSIPVDIEDIKSRDSYQEETYGFKDFTSNDKATIGLSMNLPLSPTTDLYVGSFNHYHFLKKEFNQQSLFDQRLLYRQEQQCHSNEYHLKNKIQLKHTSESLKISTDLNYVYFDQGLQESVQENYTHYFRKKHYTNNFYWNHHIEYKLSDLWGIYSHSSFSQEYFDIHGELMTNHPSALAFLSIREDFQQKNRNLQRIIQNKIGVSYKTRFLGNHSLGYKFHSNSLENEKISNATTFSAKNRKYHSENRSLFYENTQYIENLNIQLQGEYTSVTFPYDQNRNYTNHTNYFFQYKANLGYSFSSYGQLDGDLSHQLDHYPLQKATFGDILKNYQNIYKTQQAIAPFYNTSYSLRYSNTFPMASLSVAYLKGISNNLNTQSFHDFFILTQAQQLSSRYQLFSFQYERKITDWKLSYKAEPEFLFNSSDYLFRNKLAQTTAYRFFVGLKLTYTPIEQLQLYYYPKYSYFIFENSISDSLNKFNFHTHRLLLSCYLMDKKLLAEIGFQQVHFLQTSTGFNNLSLRCVYKTKKYRCFLQGDNLLGSKYFMTQDFNQSLLNISNNHVFGRYICIGFEFKIN